MSDARPNLGHVSFPQPDYPRYRLRLAGSLGTAEALHEYLWAMDLTGTRLEAIRDPFRYIIRHMIGPQYLGGIRDPVIQGDPLHHIYWYNSEFYGESHCDTISNSLYNEEKLRNREHCLTPEVFRAIRHRRWWRVTSRPCVQFISLDN